METIKDVMNFCKAAAFYDYKNIGVVVELNQVPKCKIIKFHGTILPSRILVSLSVIDDMILKFNDDDVENIIDNVLNLRDNFLYMLSFQKVVKEDVDKALKYSMLINGCKSKRKF